jgi:hypothetical protein
MLERILQLLALSCRHRHLSQPFTAAAVAQSARREWEEIGSDPGHYVVCLDCGKRFAYDWATMRIVR